MNSNQQCDLKGISGTEPNGGVQFEAEPFLTVEIPGRLPSWNAILGMETWTRYKFKTSLQQKFLCALQAIAQDSSTRTTSVPNIISTAAATLDSYGKTILARRKLRSYKRRLEKASPSLFESKSSRSEVPF